MKNDKTFYITTPIYYPSGKLHIGHSYTTVAADAMARYKRMRGFDTMFLTGTDEHGQKIETKAKEKGVTPKQYVDDIVAGILDMWKLLNISYDKFIRTTDEYHEKAVQKIFRALYEKGDIYKGEYEGWYCTPCEVVLDRDAAQGRQMPRLRTRGQKGQGGSLLLPPFQIRRPLGGVLRDRIPILSSRCPGKNEMINNFIKPGLEDLCVSRTSFTWGVPVDFDEKHVVYVWVDALSQLYHRAGIWQRGYRIIR